MAKDNGKSAWKNRIVGYGEENPNQLLANPLNFRIHPKDQQAATEGSLDTLGWIDDVIINKTTGHVVDGHLRVTLALRNNAATVPVKYVELTEEEEAQALISLDPIAAMAATDKQKLDTLIHSVQSDDERVIEYIAELAEREGIQYGAPPPEDPGAQIDKAEELREKWGVESGQLWRLGEHRLICGDCTDRATVERVMGGEKAVLFATDPPYGENAGNIGFTAQRDDIEAITKDDLKGEEMQAFLEKCFSAWLPYLQNNCAWYLWHPMLTQGYFTAAAAAAAAADLIIHRQIIWVKEQFIFGRGDYHWRHELCFYGWRKGNRPEFYGERNQDTIWNVPYDGKRSEIGHPTAKPVKLFEIPIANHTKKGDVCVDPFVGSGSQIIACERLNRKCRAIEISPAYCAVAIQRWVDMTQGIPQLVTE